jgi:small subunit ribosomal protein S4
MSRYTGPKNKLARREGLDLGLKTAGSKAHASLLKRLRIRPGQHGQKMRRKVSDFGRQLREKQKVKQMYGILENQFRKYYDQASVTEGVTGEELLKHLERRLDNVVYRMGFAPTRTAARQLVAHGHIIVNDGTVTIPSYQVAISDIIRLRDKTIAVPLVAKMLAEANKRIPEWLDVKGNAGKITTFPKREDIIEDIQEQLIVEFYSR